MYHWNPCKVNGGTRSHWVAKGPAGTKVEWDAEIVDDEPNHLISWQSLPGADVENWGTIRFEPVRNRKETSSTSNSATIRPPARWVRSSPNYSVNPRANKSKKTLRRFKQLMETGEISTTEGQPAGRCDQRNQIRKTYPQHRQCIERNYLYESKLLVWHR